MTKIRELHAEWMKDVDYRLAYQALEEEFGPDAMNDALHMQDHRDLRDEMKAVARGEKAAPIDAADASVESRKAFLHLMARKKPMTGTGS